MVSYTFYYIFLRKIQLFMLKLSILKESALYILYYILFFFFSDDQ